MIWYEYPLLIIAFAVAAVASGGFAAWDIAEAGPLADVLDTFRVFAMCAPFVVLGWVVDRRGFDRPLLYVALAATPLALLTVAAGMAAGWGWNASSAAPLERATDVMVFSGLGATVAAYWFGGGVVCAWAGVWLSQNVHKVW